MSTSRQHTEAVMQGLASGIDGILNADHGDLLDVVRGLRGSVVLSGYASPIYDSALAGWRRIEMSATGDRQTKRREVLWCNFDDVTPLFAAQPAGRMAQ